MAKLETISYTRDGRPIPPRRSQMENTLGSTGRVVTTDAGWVHRMNLHGPTDENLTKQIRRFYEILDKRSKGLYGTFKLRRYKELNGEFAMEIVYFVEDPRVVASSPGRQHEGSYLVSHQAI